MKIIKSQLYKWLEAIRNVLNSSTNRFAYLCSLFTMIVIAGNVFALKIVTIGIFTTPAGMICFPFTYSLGDVITELYGFEAARRVIIFGMINLLIYFFFINTVIYLPASPDWHLNNEFKQIFSMSTRIFFGTVAGYIVGELLNSRILSILKYITNGNIFFPRSIVATVIGVTIDTIIFNLIAFSWVMPLFKLLPFIAEQYSLKLCFELFGSLLASIAVAKFKDKEQPELIDKYTYKWIDKYKDSYLKSRIEASKMENTEEHEASGS